jgi:hypothetical protein
MLCFLVSLTRWQLPTKPSFHIANALGIANKNHVRGKCQVIRDLLPNKTRQACKKPSFVFAISYHDCDRVRSIQKCYARRKFFRKSNRATSTASPSTMTITAAQLGSNQA